MDLTFQRFLEDLAGRFGGPLSLRLILQPVMSTIFALRDGVRDAREGHPPYLRTILTVTDERRDLLRNGWKSVGRVFLFAVAMDLIYQLVVFHWIYIGEVFVTAMILAIVPYALLRGPINRIARYVMRGKVASRPVR